MSFEIHDISKVAKNEDLVRCNYCCNYFYEDITDERNDNSLKLFKDNDHFFKGCPVCETDDYLADVLLREE